MTGNKIIIIAEGSVNKNGSCGDFFGKYSGETINKQTYQKNHRMNHFYSRYLLQL
jgi:hypothetical protein